MCGAKIIPLSCAVQRYSWGVVGKESTVAQLACAKIPVPHLDGAIDPNSPYAEFWVGTHPNGPSYAEDKQLLSEKISRSLPFLLKCLSVQTALSIQAHPDAELAKELRQKNPSAYPDDQPKPEMALAINGPFEALIGFRPVADLVEFIDRIPPFRELVLGQSLASKIKENTEQDTGMLFRSIVERIMGMDVEESTHALDEIAKFFQMQRDMHPPKAVFFKLCREFPNDIGIFYSFLLNHVILQEGECVFLGANEPHAYLSGSCIELMTSSDNVVRAGLTPKFKDVPTLIGMLTYKSSSYERFLVKRQEKDDDIALYKPPIDSFALEEIRVRQGHQTNISVDQAESLLLVVEGEGILAAGDEKYSFEMGSSFYLSPLCTEVCIQANTPVRAYRAFKPNN